jgi:hypothetical protein
MSVIRFALHRFNAMASTQAAVAWKRKLSAKKLAR